MSMTGSEIAKGGFQNEQEVVDKFNDWRNDVDAQCWLQQMMYNLDEVEMVYAEKIGQKGYKSDINVGIKVNVKKKYKDTVLESVENIQVKLVSNNKGYNQVEKKKVSQYKEIWHMPDKIEELLMLYDGECPPRTGSRDSKRMFMDEFSEEERELLRSYFEKHLIMILVM